MSKRFENYGELTSSLAFDLIEILKSDDRLSVKFGFSNVSCSAYVNIDVMDEDGDYVEDGDFKVRFSDHSDRYGSDISIRIEDRVEVIEDEGEYIAVKISAEDYAEMLADAEKAVANFVAEMA